MLADNAADVVFRFRVDPDLGFDYVSPAAFALTGYTPEEHYANPDLFYSVFHPEDRLDLMQTTLQGRPMLSTARFTHRDGSIVHTEQHSRPIYDDNGNLVAVEGIVRDITERAHAQQRVDQLNRRLESQLSRFRAIHHLDTAILLDTPITRRRPPAPLTNELDVDSAAVFRLDRSRRELRPLGGRHLPDTALSVPFGRGMAGEAARTRKTVTVHDARTDTAHDTSYLRKLGMRGRLAVPLTTPRASKASSNSSPGSPSTSITTRRSSPKPSPTSSASPSNATPSCPTSVPPTSASTRPSTPAGP